MFCSSFVIIIIIFASLFNYFLPNFSLVTSPSQFAVGICVCVYVFSFGFLRYFFLLYSASLVVRVFVILLFRHPRLCCSSCLSQTTGYGCSSSVFWFKRWLCWIQGKCSLLVTMWNWMWIKPISLAVWHYRATNALTGVHCVRDPLVTTIWEVLQGIRIHISAIRTTPNRLPAHVSNSLLFPERFEPHDERSAKTKRQLELLQCALLMPLYTLFKCCSFVWLVYKSTLQELSLYAK